MEKQSWASILQTGKLSHFFHPEGEHQSQDYSLVNPISGFPARFEEHQLLGRPGDQTIKVSWAKHSVPSHKTWLVASEVFLHPFFPEDLRNMPRGTLLPEQEVIQNICYHLKHKKQIKTLQNSWDISVWAQHKALWNCWEQMRENVNALY